MMKHPLTIFFLLFAACACSKTNPGTTNNGAVDTIPNNSFIKGADISWITQMESQGIHFYNRNGIQEDGFQLMKDLGLNAIRLRAWVNPSDGWCNTAEVVRKAVRANSLGLKLMIDFHYSDSWADPGKQNKPATWASYTLAQLQAAVHDYTKHVLDTLKANGVIPQWVQVGNETNDGMLWPEGKASASMPSFASLVEAGYSAVKEADASIKVIVHLSNGYDNALYTWMFDGLKNNNAQWDIIGMSLYPSASNWQSLDAQCLSNMQALIARYGKPVMLCEVGMPWTDSTACNAFLKDIISKTLKLPNGNGVGVFYWEPEAYNNWQGYTLGAFDNSGKPTVAMDAFK